MNDGWVFNKRCFLHPELAAASETVTAGHASQVFNLILSTALTRPAIGQTLCWACTSAVYRIRPTIRGEIGPGSEKGPSSRLSLEAAVSLFKPQCSSTPGNGTHNLQSFPKRDISSSEWINLKAAITWFQQREWKYKWQHLLIQSHSFWWSGPVCYLLVQSSFSSVQSSEDYCVPFVLFIKFFHNLRTPCSLDPGERARSSARLSAINLGSQPLLRRF